MAHGVTYDDDDAEICDRSPTTGRPATEELSGGKRQLTAQPGHTCLFLRDLSSMETEMENVGKPEVDVRGDHVTWGWSGMCADDVSVLDVIETCHGVRPVLLSQHFVDRRPTISGSYKHNVGSVPTYFTIQYKFVLEN